MTDCNFKSIFQKHNLNKHKNCAKNSKKRSKKFDFKGLKKKFNDYCQTPSVKFKRTKTEGHLDLDADIGSDLEFDFKVPVLRKRAKSM